MLTDISTKDDTGVEILDQPAHRVHAGAGKLHYHCSCAASSDASDARTISRSLFCASSTLAELPK